jgi:hypothetical protein
MLPEVHRGRPCQRGLEVRQRTWRMFLPDLTLPNLRGEVKAKLAASRGFQTNDSACGDRTDDVIVTIGGEL